VQAAIGLDKFLGIQPSGAKRAALDVADRGSDRNAFVITHGVLLYFARSWSGKGSDTGHTTAQAFRLCDEHGLMSFEYDADGIGATVHSDQRFLNEHRLGAQATKRTPEEYFASGAVSAIPYRGSEAVVHPDKFVTGTKRKAKDFFANRKAQSWWTARLRFYQSWKARNGKEYNATEIICIAEDIPERDKLVSQLSQATVKETATGKIQIEKAPEGASSPDLADAVVMAFAPRAAKLPPMGALLAAVGGQR
jgi:hypothetical protein